MHVLLCVEAQADVDGLPPLFPFLFTEAGSLWSFLIQLALGSLLCPSPIGATTPTWILYAQRDLKLQPSCLHGKGFINRATSRVPVSSL